jgi:hypothetical protein
VTYVGQRGREPAVELLELISTDLFIKTKFISHALIGGVLLYLSGSGPPLHSAYKKHGTEVRSE